MLYGWRRGFILGLLDLLGWCLVLVVALRFYQPVARWVGAHTERWPEIWDRPIAFVLIAIAVGVLILVIFGVITIGSQTLQAVFINPVDNLKND